jgi:hypothetical protein
MSLSMGVFCSAPRDNSKKWVLQTEFDLIFSGFLPFQTENSLTTEIVTKTRPKNRTLREGETNLARVTILDPGITWDRRIAVSPALCDQFLPQKNA